MALHKTPTPETDELVRGQLARVGMTPPVLVTKLTIKCESLERERDEAREYADKLAEGLPDGMLPKDVEVLREANLGLATEVTTVTEQRDYMTIRLGETQERMIDAERQRDEWKAKYIQQNKDLGYNLPWIDFAR